MSRILALLTLVALSGAIYHYRQQIINLFQPPPPPEPQIVEKTANPPPPKEHKMHKWVDADGRVHFSDSAPKTQEQTSRKISVNELQTTEFKKTKPVYVPTYRNQSNYTNRNTSSSRSSRCKQLRQSIKQSERSIRERNNYTRSFESKKKQLQQKRWELQKNC